MKRILSLLLCAAMLITALTACSGDAEDKGAIIPVYLDTQINTFDPAYAYTDDSAIKFLGLIYQGLTEIDAGGKVKNLMMKDYKYTEDESKGIYKLEIEIKNTCWSDGRQMMADDFVYAWKRLLSPGFASEAASMLFEIKNARAAKMGDVSIDDVKLYASDLTVIEVQFEHSVDPDVFFEYCASPALVPLREDVIAKGRDWSTNPTILVTNGPFGVRNYIPGSTIVLDRNIYYFRDVKKDGLKKYVTPYRLVMIMSDSPETQLANYNNGVVQYIDYIPLASRAEYAKKVKTQATLNTHTYFFNTTRAPFDDASVRRALSMALDRDYIVSLITYADAATGMVPDGVGKVASKKSYRDVAGDVIATTADLAGAKALIDAANVSDRSFTISIRETETDRAVAEYCASVWEQLGFTVDIVALGTTKYTENEYDMYSDAYSAAYGSSDFDVIAVDWQALSTRAWSTLAPFATGFSGGYIDLKTSNETGIIDTPTHVTGYESAEYDAIIERAFAAAEDEKNTILAEAEKLLAADMPVMPLFTYQDAYMMSGKLSVSGAKTAYFGYRKFAKLSFKNYKTFETTSADAGEPEGEDD